MKLPSLSPCDLSSSHLDLSFENLCLELLALSASCTNLERMINETDHSLESKDEPELRKKEARHTSDGEAGAETKDSKLAFDTPSRSDISKDVSGQQVPEMPPRIWPNSISPTKMEPKLNRQSPNTTKLPTSPENSPSSSSCLVPEIPPRTHTSFMAVQKIADQHFSHKSELLFTPAYQRQSSQESRANKVSSVVIAPDKLQALTVDVGQNRSSKTAKVSVPVKNGLITITSPQPCLFSDAQCERVKVNHQRNHQASCRSRSALETSHSNHCRIMSSSTEVRTSEARNAEVVSVQVSLVRV